MYFSKRKPKQDWKPVEKPFNDFKVIKLNTMGPKPGQSTESYLKNKPDKKK
jgi:hypothetical protein